MGVKLDKTKNEKRHSMKIVQLLICFFLICFYESAAADKPTIASAKAQNGVFFTNTGYEFTILELKDGRFRYWFEADKRSNEEPDYPLTGEYAVSGDTITLKHDRILRRQWTFCAINGLLTLWLPNNIEAYERDQSLDFARLKRFGLGGVLISTDKLPEDAWKHRGPPTQ